MAVTAGRDGLTLQVIQDDDEWDAIGPAWDALYQACPTATTPVDFAWARTWWSVYGTTYGPGGLRIVTAWRDGRLVAALPLYLNAGRGARFGERTLQFLSTGEDEHEEVCPDYLDLLCQPADAPVVAGAIWREVMGLSWDGLEWIDMPSGSPLLEAGLLPPGTEAVSRGACPIADLEGGFEAYLGRLSSNSRQQARRLLRDGERAGARFEIVGERGATSAFDDLCRLHQARWQEDGRPGVFAAPRFVAFHRQLVEQWLPRGRAVLGRLTLAGEPTAVLYGFLTGRKFDFYQSGVQMGDGSPLRSPGNLAHLLLMQALSVRGVTAYDFLRGASAYKDRLSTRQQALEGVRIRRSTPRALSARAWQLAARGLRRYASGRAGA